MLGLPLAFSRRKLSGSVLTPEVLKYSLLHAPRSAFGSALWALTGAGGDAAGARLPAPDLVSGSHRQRPQSVGPDTAFHMAKQREFEALRPVGAPHAMGVMSLVAFSLIVLHAHRFEEPLLGPVVGAAAAPF